MLQQLLVPAALQTVFSVIVALLILLATITVHEFGHYIVGKILKFKIKEFAIGMGPAIFKKTKKNGEVFSIRVFPLGGFCAFEGEDEDDETIKKKQELAKKSKKGMGANDLNDTALHAENENNAVYDEYKDNKDKGLETAQKEPEIKPLSKDAFNNKKPWQRILVLLAGATFNFIVAVLIVIIQITAYGHFGFMAYEVAAPNSLTEAETSLSNGDVLLSVNGKFLYFTTDLADALDGKKQGDRVEVTVQHADGTRETKTVTMREDVNISDMSDIYPALRGLGVATVLKLSTEQDSPFKDGYVFRFKDNENNADCTRIYTLDDLYNGLKTLNAGETITLIVPDGEDEDTENDLLTITAPINFNGVDKADKTAVLGAFGIKNEESLSYQISSETIRFGFFEGIGRGIVYSFKTIGITLRSFGQLLTGRLSLTSVSGPVGTISLTTQYVQLGFKYVLNIASMIGLSIAIFNLLPIPALDGARAVFVLIEWIRKKPINRNVEGMIHFVGLIVLLLFAVTVDLLKLF